MFWALVGKELRRAVFDSRFGLVFVLIVGASLTATAVQTHLHNHLLSSFNDAKQRRSLVYTRPSIGEFGGFMGNQAEKRPNPLAIFCCGIENQLTRTLRSDIWDSDRMSGPKLGSLFFRVNFAFDIVTIMEIVGSLLALLLVYDAVCGERQEGTLRLMLAGPLPRHTIILAIGVSRLITVLLPCAIAWCASVVYVLLFSHDPLTAHHLLRVGVMALASCLYLLTFLAAGLAASVLCSRDTSALAVCVLYWVVMALGVPMLTLHLSLDLAGGLPRLVAERQLLVGQETVLSEAAKRTDDHLRQGGDTVGAKLGAYMGTGSRLKELAGDMAVSQVNAMSRQRLLVRWLAGLSPTTSYANLSTDVAGTGTGHYATLLRLWSQTKYDLFAKQLDQPMPLDPPVARLREVVADNAQGLLGLCLYSILFLLTAFLLFVARDPA